MAVNRGKRHPRKFGKSGGIHSAHRKIIYQHKHRYMCKVKKHVQCQQNSVNRLLIVRRSILNKYKLRQKHSECFDRLLFSKHLHGHYNIKRVSSDKPFTFKISKVKCESYDGYRLMNLQLLQQHIDDIALHVAKCEKVKNIVSQAQCVSPVKLTSEVRTLGLASVIEAQCQGCQHQFRLDTSPQIRNGRTNHYDVNLRAVWGSMVTGGGSAHLNETMATLNAPGLSQTTYSNIEQEVGDMWNLSVQDDLLAAGAEERKIAIEKGNYHDEVPCITVVCDGGWSKRSHKHTYNALGGVAVIIGVETGKLLHIGVRNKHCYICSQSEANHTKPRPHRCFRNWSESSQAMESDIIVEGFQQAEKVHGLRYTTVIADGDSSVYAKIQENVPVWGKHVQKLECANHICKCLRSSLEKLVDQNPMYKGKNRLSKALRVRLTSAVRCAIRIRSKETDKSTATKQLDQDIRNSIYHILGTHDRCSDFCKAKVVPVPKESQISSNEVNNNNNEDASEVNSIPNVIDELSTLWTEGTSIAAQEESRGDSTSQSTDINSMMLRDINVLLDRVASKSNRLLGHSTTNLAESWMAIRAKFDGGKLYNRCNRGSWHSRCFGGCLRKNLGPLWSHITWQKATSIQPGFFFKKLYERRSCTLTSCKNSKMKPDVQTRRLKRKYQGQQQSQTKKARMEYGPEALDSIPDISPEQLEEKKKMFLDKHINFSVDKLDAIERCTKQQSSSAVWIDERRKRITSSNFSAIIKRKPTIPVKKLVQSLLYCRFKGNSFTRRGIQEETMTIKEYISKKSEDDVHVSVHPCGLIVSKENKFLAASPDGKIIDENCEVIGLLELKNLLHSKPLNLHEAVKYVKTFCLEHFGPSNELRLKRNHPYFYQVQGQLNVSNLPWADFVVRTTNPYQLHIEKIYVDKKLWNDHMLPKLKAFYFKALLPELASPRNNTTTGIREPGTWFHGEKVTASTSNQPNDDISASSSQKTSGSSALSSKTRKRKKSSSTASTSQTPALGQHTTHKPSFGSNRSKRVPRIKFVGRRISHEWEDSDANKIWYNGTVSCTLSGKDGDPTAVYEVLYDGDQDPYRIDHLLEDYMSSSLKFIDV